MKRLSLLDVNGKIEWVELEDDGCHSCPFIDDFISPVTGLKTCELTQKGVDAQNCFFHRPMRCPLVEEPLSSEEYRRERIDAKDVTKGLCKLLEAHRKTGKVNLH